MGFHMADGKVNSLAIHQRLDFVTMIRNKRDRLDKFRQSAALN
jgi:hypothetical protein